jgi:hypothetical protein
MKKIQIGRYNVWISGTPDDETLKGIRSCVLGGSLGSIYNGVRFRAITHPLYFQWGLAGGITRSMRVAEFVAAEFDRGTVVLQSGERSIGWPVSLEAALNAAPLAHLQQAVDLTTAGMGCHVPATLALVAAVVAQ